MSRRRKNAGAGYGYMFSGAFAKKADAVKKEKKRKGSFVKTVWVNGDMRYAVLTPRTNPVKRRRKNASSHEGTETSTSTGGGYGAETGGAATGGASTSTGGAAGGGTTTITISGDGARTNPRPRKNKSLAHITINSGGRSGDSRAMSERVGSGYGPGRNPAELMVMGANPGPQEIVIPPNSTITIRTNPERSNSLGTFFGFAPKRPTKKELAQSKREFKQRVRTKTGEIGTERKRLRGSARRGFKNKGKLQQVFHEVYGQQQYDREGLPSNPAPICGASIGGYPCTRKPGHRGPHLPQGATMRTRKRLPHHWQPNPSAGALREKFTGKEAGHVRILDEPHMPAGDYAALGKLLGLYVKPRAGGQVLAITAHGVTVVSDESARQIYFVGGDQDVSAGLGKFGAVDRGAGLFELGEARRIDYKQRKEHVPHPESDSWRHDFGEESGVRPCVLFDVNAKRLLLEGGEYEIREEGIVN